MSLTSFNSPASAPSANAPAAFPKPPALDNTYGALLLGVCFALMLYGLTVHQCYRYARMYPQDGVWLKCLILAIFILESFQVTLCIVAVYYHLVSNYFKPSSLLAGHWSTQLLIPVAGVTVILCQIFYAFRVCRKVGSHYAYLVMVAIAGVCMVCEFGFVLAATVEAFRFSLGDFQHRDLNWLFSAVFGCAVLGDACLTGTLVTALARSRTGSKRTDSLIEVLIIYSINTGLLTSIFGLLTFIFAIILPGNLIYLGIAVVGVKLYANSVLAVLNARKSLSNRVLHGFEMSSWGQSAARGRARDAEAGPLETWNAREPTTNIVVMTVPSHGSTRLAADSDEHIQIGEDKGIIDHHMAQSEHDVPK